MREYARMGLLWPAAKRVLRHPFSRQTYKQVYLDTVRKVEPLLVKEYGPVMREMAEHVTNGMCAHPKSLFWQSKLRSLAPRRCST